MRLQMNVLLVKLSRAVVCLTIIGLTMCFFLIAKARMEVPEGILETEDVSIISDNILDSPQISYYYSYVCPNESVIRKTKTLREDFDQTVLRRHPNLLRFLIDSQYFSASIPDIESIRWSGTVYQESWRESPKLFLYSAHFDARPNKGLVVRIISLWDGEVELNSTEIYCKMWFSRYEIPIVTPVIGVFLLFYEPIENKYLRPYGITCQVPEFQNSSSVPIAVSLVKQPCQTPTNILKIHGSTVKRKILSKANKLKQSPTIAICGKALFYYNEDFSVRLIEWIEMMRALGVAKIFLYKMPVHKNVEKVLDYYEESGFVNLVTFSIPPPYVQEGTFIRTWTKTSRKAWFAIQSIYINDCLLRNKDHFDYIGVFDSDEVPILRRHKTLPDFLKFMIKTTYDRNVRGFLLKWKHFYRNLKPGKYAEKISESFYILHHNKRTQLFQPEVKVIETTGKSIYDTNFILYAQCHTPLRFLANHSEEAAFEKLHRRLAYTAHFGDHECRGRCTNSYLEEENTLLKFKDTVIAKVSRVSNVLKLNM